MSETHGISGYKKRKCRCEECRGAYEKHLIMQRLRKRRRTPIKHHLFDATPLVNIYRETNPRSSSLRSIIKRWEREGISAYEADIYCMRLGLHPIEVFGSVYFEGLFEEEEQYRQIYGEFADV